jgi:hypothetical protein
MSLTTCIGCGCTDTNPCLGGCHWLVIFDGHAQGICSECPETFAAWEAEAEEKPALILPGDPEFDATLGARR